MTLHVIPQADYHRDGRLSSHGITQLLRSPLHYKQWRLSGGSPPTPARRFGIAVHTLTLEPEKFDAQFAIMPTSAPTRQSNAGRQWHENFAREHANKLIITVDDLTRAQACVAAVLASPGWRFYVGARGHIERSIFWQDEIGVGKKARPDYLPPDLDFVLDLKTADNASFAQFQRDLWNYRYDVQAEHYLQALRSQGAHPHSFVWCVVETAEPPHCVAWYRIGPNDLEVARADIRIASELFKKCAASRNWPGYSMQVQDIRLPAYARPAQVNLGE